MTAADELKAMLKKRRVLYVEDDFYAKKYPPEQKITWTCDIAGEAMTITARDYCVGITDDGEWEYCLDLEFHQVFTPAQAIAATLGTGTCHLEEIEKDCDTASEYMLNREWCFDAVYRCSCGCRFGHAAHDRPRFCPNCGARIVEVGE